MGSIIEIFHLYVCRIGLAMNSVTNFLKVALNCLIQKIIQKIWVCCLAGPLNRTCANFNKFCDFVAMRTFEIRANRAI